VPSFAVVDAFEQLVSDPYVLRALQDRAGRPVWITGCWLLRSDCFEIRATSPGLDEPVFAQVSGAAFSAGRSAVLNVLGEALTSIVNQIRERSGYDPEACYAALYGDSWTR
jgi:hypothetical protein